MFGPTRQQAALFSPPGTTCNTPHTLAVHSSIFPPTARSWWCALLLLYFHPHRPDISSIATIAPANMAATAVEQAWRHEEAMKSAFSHSFSSVANAEIHIYKKSCSIYQSRGSALSKLVIQNLGRCGALLGCVYNFSCAADWNLYTYKEKNSFLS